MRSLVLAALAALSLAWATDAQADTFVRIGFGCGGRPRPVVRRVVVRRTVCAPTCYTPTYYSPTYYAPTYYSPAYYSPAYYAPTYYRPAWTVRPYAVYRPSLHLGFGYGYRHGYRQHAHPSRVIGRRR